MKQYTKPYSIVITLLLVIVLVLSLSGCSIDFAGGSFVLTLWASVITIVFIVFSIIGLLNIDSRIKELHGTKKQLEDTIRSTEEKTGSAIKKVDDTISFFEKSAKEEEKKIRKAAHEEITKMLNKSINLQNLSEQISLIRYEMEPSKRIVGYTDFLQAHPNAEGVNYSYVHICRGNAYCELGLFEKGLADFEEAHRINPNDVSPLVSLAVYCANQKDYEKSIDYFKKALEINPNQASLHLDIANSYSCKGDFKEAEKHYNKAADLSVECADYYYNKARMLSDEGSDSEGHIREEYLKHCLTLNPAYFRARINLAAIYRDRKDEITARNVLSEVISSEMNEDYVMAVLQRGFTNRMSKDFAAALIDFEIVHHFRPLNVQNLSNLAITHLALAHIPEALAFAKKGMEQAEKQNKHDCDQEFKGVLTEIERLKALHAQINGTSVKLKKNDGDKE